ncbi:MAG: stage III sporulation protein AE, partial [Cohnella sp.]|nr:stage III sporulation protein AE [Cohnella sp.]
MRRHREKGMRLGIALVVVVICLLMGNCGTVQAAAPAEIGQADPAASGAEISGELAKDQSEDVNTQEIEQYWNNLKREYGGYFPDGKLPELRELMFPSGEGWSAGQAIAGLARFFLHEVLYSGKLLVTIVL